MFSYLIYYACFQPLIYYLSNVELFKKFERSIKTLRLVLIRFTLFNLISYRSHLNQLNFFPEFEKVVLLAFENDNFNI